jgi:general secretion pathway protein D
VVLTGCAHESTITPSQGHIGSEVQTTAAAPAGDIPKPVRKPAYVPPPKPRVKEQTYSVVVSDVPVREILFALARESKSNIDIQPGISGYVTLNAVDQPLLAILDRISKQVNLIYKYEGNVLTISPDLPSLKTYQINYLNIERNTTGGISVTNQLASAGTGSDAVGSSGSSSSGQNNSTTSVESISKNHFWENLEKNIKEILAESDKQVVISRLDSDARLQNEYNGSASGTGSVDVGGQKERISKTGESTNSSGGVKGSGNEIAAASTSENAQKSLKSYQTLFASSIISNRESGVLSIRATQKQHEKIREFIDQVQAGARRQVMIEATIVEVTLNDQFSAGIDWSRLGPSGLTFDQSLAGGSLSDSTSKFIIGYSNKTVLGTLAGSIKLLEGFGKTKVLSSPKLMVLNSQTAVLKVVDNLVWFKVTVTPATLNSSGGVSSPAIYTTTPNTMPVGVWMSVTPQINENGIVTLDVRPTIARKVGDVRDPNPSLLAAVPNNIPKIQVREMASILQIPSGNTVVLGGLMQDNIQESNEDVPVVSTLPLIGKLFKSKNDATTKTELVIFLRPTVITNASLESDELKSFKQFLPDQLPTTAADESAN